MAGGEKVGKRCSRTISNIRAYRRHNPGRKTKGSTVGLPGENDVQKEDGGTEEAPREEGVRRAERSNALLAVAETGEGASRGVNDGSRNQERGRGERANS